MNVDLIPWLRAQLDEDVALIERNSGQKGITDAGCFPDYRTYDGEDLLAADDYLTMFNPKRMLAEVDAKRRILALHDSDHECSTIQRGTIDGKPYEDIDSFTWVLDGDCSTVRLLALPYADHPGYREDWRP